MMLIDDIKKLPRMWSVQLASLAIVLEMAEALLPLLGDYLPWWVSVLILIAGIAARGVKQPGLHA